MSAQRIRRGFHWVGLAIAVLIVLVMAWPFTAIAVHGLSCGIGWLVARFTGDNNAQISN
jgi:lauroyl/myristoyl acyltransferase